MEDNELLKQLIGGLLVLSGFLAKALSDYLSDRRLSAREAEKRKEERQDAYRLRRFNSQRETLRDIQDQIVYLGRTITQSHHHYTLKHREGDPWHTTMLPEVLNDGVTKAQQEISKLNARIRSEEIRSLVVKIKVACTDVVMASSENHGDMLMMELMKLTEQFHSVVNEEFNRIDLDENY